MAGSRSRCSASCTCKASPFMPRRMSVRPTASQTRTSARTTQTIENTAEHLGVEVDTHAKAVGVGDFDLDAAVGCRCGSWRARHLGLRADHHRHQPRPDLRRHWQWRRLNGLARPPKATPSSDIVAYLASQWRWRHEIEIRQRAVPAVPPARRRAANPCRSRLQSRRHTALFAARTVCL